MMTLDTVIAVMVLFYGVDRRNSWFFASVVLRTRQKFPLQLILRETLLQGQSLEISAGSFGGSSDEVLMFETVKYAAVIIATLPILMLNPFLQKHFVKGVMIGAIKG